MSLCLVILVALVLLFTRRLILLALNYTMIGQKCMPSSLWGLQVVCGAHPLDSFVSPAERPPEQWPANSSVFCPSTVAWPRTPCSLFSGLH